jgi:hypothetical protein
MAMRFALIYVALSLHQYAANGKLRICLFAQRIKKSVSAIGVSASHEVGVVIKQLQHGLRVCGATSKV